MIESTIRKLICYGKEHNLFTARDEIYVTNRILETLNLDSFGCTENYQNVDLEETLRDVLDYAVKKGIIEDGVTARDLFDTKIMGLMLPRPSEVTDKFYSLLKESPEKATEYYYDLSKSSDYIRTYRVKRDLKWKAESEYGELDITINLSKPEKDAKSILAEKNAPQSGYPKCLLCKECEGYAGRSNFPARQNHRVIPITLDGENWFVQYSPYVYYNEHCIAFNSEHIPMKVDVSTFRKLFDFIDLLPHYTIGSNAGLPVVGGSILSHEHYQGGRYVFPMAKAKAEKVLSLPDSDGVEAVTIKWPMACIRLTGADREKVTAVAERVLKSWENYSDPEVQIFAETDGEPHNTVTPIARMVDGKYQLDLVLRNNLTTKEYPLGVFHPHEKLHHIKKENIGLIEVMGLAVLPSRLKKEMAELKTALLNGDDISNSETLSKHKEWAEEIKAKYTLTPENTEEILKTEIGNVFKLVLEDAGVFKRDAKGMAALEKFLKSIK